MQNNAFIEKNFLYLFVFSLALHLLFAFLVYSLPEAKKNQVNEPYMVDLQDLPELKQPKAPEPEKVERLDEIRRRVLRETAPRGDEGLDRLIPAQTAPRSKQQTPLIIRPETPRSSGTAGEVPVRELQPRRGEGLFKPSPPQQQPAANLDRLMPSAERLAKLEETYRRKFREEVEEGDAHFLNTNDLQFGSFLRRLETAVYGVWRYPQEAVRLGIEGMTPVRIIFNRRGEIESASVLESSGSRILDEEVLRTLRKIGIVGGFPKNYDKDTFTLIAFFHYGIVKGETRSLR